MIKPPFTLLILKNPHRPLVIRISVPLFILLAAIFIMLSGASGYGLLMAVSSASRGRMFASNPVAQSPAGIVSPGTTGSPAPRPEISGLFVSPAREGGTEVSFSLTNTAPGELYYLWIVANPDAAGSGSFSIHPRNPVFHGLPVDYRNGEIYDRSEGGEVSVTIGEEEPRLTVEKLRILVYSSDGKILTDKQFTVGQNTRSSSP